jgi:hypothetical protein
VGNNFNHVVVLTGQAASREIATGGAITSKGIGRKKPRRCFERYVPKMESL